MKRPAYLVLPVLIPLVCFFAAGRLFKGYSPLQAVSFFAAPAPGEIPELGQPVVEALLAHKEKHGRFPRSLQSAGLMPAETFYGQWEYRAFDDGNACELSRGDYGRYLFEVSWSNDYGWYVDT